jgi:hypothetical protein
LTGTGLLWPTDHQQPAIDGPTDGPRHELGATLVDLGFEPVPPTATPHRPLRWPSMTDARSMSPATTATAPPSGPPPSAPTPRSR